MKKYLLTIMCIITLTANAQDRKSGYGAEIGIGANNYGNYSEISLFNDDTKTYSLITSEHLTLGYYSSDKFFTGITIGFEGGNTSAAQYGETFSNTSILLDVRSYHDLCKKLELEFAPAVGLLLRNNAFRYNNDDYSFSRTGISAQLKIGINYKLSDKSYFGVKAVFPIFGIMLSEKPELPVGLQPNNREHAVGYGIQIGYGIRF